MSGDSRPISTDRIPNLTMSLTVESETLYTLQTIFISCLKISSCGKIATPI